MRSPLSRFPAVAIATALLIGCGGPPLRMPPGRPTFDSGSLPGFYIWNDPEGWHLRLATQNERHGFKGIIEPIDGTIVAFRPTRLGLGKLGVRPEAIHFHIGTKAIGEGFAWRSTADCMRFTLNIDDEAKSHRVYLGAEQLPPAYTPFVRCASRTSQARADAVGAAMATWRDPARAGHGTCCPGRQWTPSPSMGRNRCALGRRRERSAGAPRRSRRWSRRSPS